MPILWRFLLRNYLQVFLLSVTGFIAVLLVMRFKEIAQFAALNPDLPAIALFTLYQMPNILPHAIPISCLIASMLLFQSLSHHGELSALRSSGFGLKPILLPLVLISGLLSLINFTVVSELGPVCRTLSKELSYKITASNPFYIVQQAEAGKIPNTFIQLKTLKDGKRAKDVLLIMNNKSNHRLGLATAKELFLEREFLLGKQITLVSGVAAKSTTGFDHMVIENHATMTTKASHLSELLRGSIVQGGLEYQPFRMLMAKAIFHGQNGDSHKSQKIFLEISRRVLLALAPIVFTLIGSAFGMEIGRKRTKKGIIWAISLCALYLFSFLGAKSMHKTAWVAGGAAWIYLFPLPILLFFARRSLKKISRGIE
jgi:lipopolysaccharide export system permease protein